MALNGKSAIVTGAAGGIGLAIAERFVREGARVILADTDMDAGHDAEKRLGDLGTAVFVKTDASRRLDVHNLVATALNMHGDIDVLVTAASYRRPGDFLTLREDDFDRALAANLKGVFLAGQAVARCMVERVEKGGEPGSIIALGALDADLADLAWSVSRPSVHHLVRAMATVLSQWRIRVNAIGFDGPASTARDKLDDQVAATVAWLAGGGAGDLSGAILAPGETGQP